jgi:hypothetical protein
LSALDREILAEKASAVHRHLARVTERLPLDPSALAPATDASDAVILHLWQAVQIVIDLAMSACLYLRLGAPGTHADAFRRLAEEAISTPRSQPVSSEPPGSGTSSPTRTSGSTWRASIPPRATGPTISARSSRR